MFKKLTNAIRTWFQGTPDTLPLTTDDLYTMYRRIHEVTRKAETLAQILEVRQQIMTFQQAAIQNKQELWARPYVTELFRLMRVKYSRWKTTRG